MALSHAAPTELGTEKIGKLLKMYAVPGIIAQTAASLYNMVDSIYIGHMPGVGSAAISGLAVTFPLMNLSVAMGTLVGVGAMTLLSVLLGQKNYDAVKKLMSNVFTLNIIIGVLFSVVTLVFLEPILRFFGASDVTLPYAKDYMIIILSGNMITHLYHGLNGLIRTSGHPKTAMVLTLCTVILNAILDPIFIFVLDLGIQGAAIATILCQTLAFIYTMKFFSDKTKIVHFSRPLFQVDWRIAKQSLAIGVGPFLMNAAACMVSMVINQQLGKYGGDLAIGAYGIANRFTMFFVMICMGFNQGLQPIAGYNYGARQYRRVKQIFVLTAKWEVLVTMICCLLSVIVPQAAVSLFTNDPLMVEKGSMALRHLNAGFAMVGFSMVAGNFFQCLGMVKTSIFLSLSRQLLLLVPLIFILPAFFEEKGVWFSFPISDILSVIISAILILRLFRKFDTLKDGGDADILGSAIK